MKNENKDIRGLLDKAKESLAATESLFRDGFYDYSAGRAYYAMFYAAEAVLITKNISFSKHNAVISGFEKYFIRSRYFLGNCTTISQTPLI